MRYLNSLMVLQMVIAGVSFGAAVYIDGLDMKCFLGGVGVVMVGMADWYRRGMQKETAEAITRVLKGDR